MRMSERDSHVWCKHSNTWGRDAATFHRLLAQPWAGCLRYGSGSLRCHGTIAAHRPYAGNTIGQRSPITLASLCVLVNLFACWKISLQDTWRKKKRTPQTVKINYADENKWRAHVCHGPTWHTSDAPHVGVTSVEAVKQVSRLSGVQYHNLGGGVRADAHPHSTGHLVLQHQLLVLVPSLLNIQI